MKAPPQRRRPPPSRARGIALITVLLLLLALSAIAAMAAHRALWGERGTRAERDMEVALQAAEAALHDAERDLLGPNDAPAARLCRFNNRDVAAFVPDCAGTGQQRGLCAAAAPGDTPAWQKADLSPDGRTSVPYGHFTGQRYATGQAQAPAAPPRYVVEALRNQGGWEAARLQNASAGQATQLFRVTAIGFGTQVHTQVVLQTHLYKPSVSAGCP